MMTDNLSIRGVKPYLLATTASLSEGIFSDPLFPYKEELLQFIWESRLFSTEDLRTTEGSTVEVVLPGVIQTNGGPDLIGAAIRMDGQLWAGSVEVHVHASEWYAHGHHRDPAYDNVVLHVVFRNDREVFTSKGTRVPTVVLGPRIDPESLSTYQRLMEARSWVPCAGQLSGIEPDLSRTWLKRLLVQRMERRTRRIDDLFRSLQSDPSAVLYHLLAQAFGLKVNAEAFGMLAHALPLKIAMKYRDDPMRLEALVFGQAGFLQVDFVEEHPRMIQEEYQALARLHRMEPIPVAAWKFSRMRPVNFPTVRLAQFAALLGRSNGDLTQLLEQDSMVGLRSMLRVSPSAYWHSHYRFDRPSPESAKRLGRDAADHMIINAVAPALYALGGSLGRPQWRDRALMLLEQLPAERNTVLDHWSQHGLHAANAGQGQALLELRSLYCAGRKCLFCGIGRRLLRSGKENDSTTAPYR